MSNISRIEPGSLPAKAVMPLLSADLGYAVDRWRSVGDTAFAWLTPQCRAEARARLAEFEAMCEPPAEVAVWRWMDLVRLGVTNPPPDSHHAAIIALVRDTSGDLPRAVWTRETRAGFARRGERAAFYPSDGEVDAFLRPIGNAILARRDALRALLRGNPAGAADDQPPMTDGERQSIVATIAAKLRANEAYLAEQAVAREGPRVVEMTLPDVTLKGEHLAAVRRARGVGPLSQMPSRLQQAAVAGNRHAVSDADVLSDVG